MKKSIPLVVFSSIFAQATASSTLPEQAQKSVITPDAQVATTNIFFNDLPAINDLKGSGDLFRAKISYAQNITHYQTPAPGDVRPHLVSERDTLLMVQPSEGNIDTSVPLTVTASDAQGNTLGQLSLARPSQQPNNDGPPLNGILYANNLWSVIMPSRWIKPGLKLTFAHAGKTGYVDNLKIGAPNEVLINTIDIGMLTTPRNKFDFADSAELHSDYFQKIPVSRLIVNNYQPLYLNKVVLSDGVTYTNHSSNNGDWHNGDMRQDIAKVLISHGINNANYGIHSSDGIQESAHSYVVSQITTHNAIGRYTNHGVVTNVIHGGSGGNGVATIDNSKGNEWSHELGHNYDLGHYPGDVQGSVHRKATDLNSAWGWDRRSNRFIANFSWSVYGDQICCPGSVTENIPPFNNKYQFNTDAMAGGVASSRISAYTLHTPFVLEKIQRHLEDKAVFSTHSATGFKKWNPEKQKMEDFTHKKNLLTISLNDQSILNKIANDVQGDYIVKQLSFFNHMKIQIRDGAWISMVHLPNPTKEMENKAISIRRQSVYSVQIKVNDNYVTLERDQEKYYIANNGQWVNIDGSEIENRKENLTPVAHGVPVTTLVGFYDPQNKLSSYIYPALHGAYGFVYPADVINESSKDKCLLKVEGNQETQTYELVGTRLDDSRMNKFHVNIPRKMEANRAEIICHGNTLATLNIQKPVSEPIYTINGISSKSVKTLTQQDEITALGSGPGVLASYYQNNMTVVLKTRDGAWTSDVFLPEQATTGQKFVLERLSTYTVNIHFNGKIISTPEANRTTTFSYQNGMWYQDKEV